MAMADDYTGALNALREYWGGMLKMGATTFWEDFSLDWMENAAPIDDIVPEGKVDIHGDWGAYCYVKFRHSLCHGWASGPVPFLTRYILGVNVLEPGSRLPSVRMLAEELAINPNTVQKAYRMLEHSGVIETVPGKGSFLCDGERAKQLQKGRSRQALLAGIQAALDAGMTPLEIRQEGEAYLQEKGAKRL